MNGVSAIFSNGTEINEKGWPNTDPGTNWFTTIFVYDVNNDTKDEIIVASDTNPVTVLYNNGSTLWTSGSMGGDMNLMLTTANLDNLTLKNDIVIAISNGTVNVLYAYNSTDGSNWTRKWYFVIGGNGWNSRVNELDAVDLNNDGIDDIVAVTRNGTYTIFGNNGSLYWKHDLLVYASAIIDYDHDGKMDELLVDELYFESNGSNVENTSIDVGYYDEEQIAIDHDDDGYIDDVVVADTGSYWSSGNYKLYLFNNSGNLIWTYSVARNGSTDSNHFNNLDSSDVNDDNVVEIIGASSFERSETLG